MSLDESRQERRSGRINHLRARRYGDRGGTGGSLDVIPLNADHPSFVKRLAVEHARRPEHRHGGRVAGRALLRGGDELHGRREREPDHITFHRPISKRFVMQRLRRPCAARLHRECPAPAWLLDSGWGHLFVALGNLEGARRHVLFADARHQRLQFRRRAASAAARRSLPASPLSGPARSSCRSAGSSRPGPRISCTCPSPCKCRRSR